MKEVQSVNCGQVPEEKKRKKRTIAVILAALVVLAAGVTALVLTLRSSEEEPGAENALPSREEQVVEIVNTYCYDAYYDGYSEEATSGDSLERWEARVEDASMGAVDVELSVNEDIPKAAKAAEFRQEYEDVLCVEFTVWMNDAEDYRAYFLFGCDSREEKEPPVPLCITMMNDVGHYTNYLAHQPKGVITVMYTWMLYLESYHEVLRNYGVEPVAHDGTFADFSSHTILTDVIKKVT